MADEKIDNPWLIAYSTERLEAFLSGELPLHALVADLESAVRLLRDVDERWMKEFHRLWLELEIHNAVQLSEEDPGESCPEPEDAVHRLVHQLLGYFSRLDHPR